MSRSVRILQLPALASWCGPRNWGLEAASAIAGTLRFAPCHDSKDRRARTPAFGVPRRAPASGTRTCRRLSASIRRSMQHEPDRRGRDRLSEGWRRLANRAAAASLLWASSRLPRPFSAILDDANGHSRLAPETERRRDASSATKHTCRPAGPRPRPSSGRRKAGRNTLPRPRCRPSVHAISDWLATSQPPIRRRRPTAGSDRPDRPPDRDGNTRQATAPPAANGLPPPHRPNRTDTPGGLLVP